MQLPAEKPGSLTPGLGLPGCRGLLIWRKRRVPMFLEWPRPELWFLWAVMPIIAGQSASEHP